MDPESEFSSISSNFWLASEHCIVSSRDGERYFRDSSAPPQRKDEDLVNDRNMVPRGEGSIIKLSDTYVSLHWFDRFSTPLWLPSNQVYHQLLLRLEYGVKDDDRWYHYISKT